MQKKKRNKKKRKIEKSPKEREMDTAYPTYLLTTVEKKEGGREGSVALSCLLDFKVLILGVTSIPEEQR